MCWYKLYYASYVSDMFDTRKVSFPGAHRGIAMPQMQYGPWRRLNFFSFVLATARLLLIQFIQVVERFGPRPWLL